MAGGINRRIKSLEDKSNPERGMHVIDIYHDFTEEEIEKARQEYLQEKGLDGFGSDLVVHLINYGAPDGKEI
jgi:hypothetical protein